MFNFNAFLTRSQSVLDFGCGDGSGLLSLSYREGRMLTGLDSDEKSVAQAKLNGQTRSDLTFLAGNILVTPEILTSYDLILAHDTFVLFPPQQKLKLIEIFLQHLRPGGGLVINEFNYKVFWGNAFGNLLRGRLDRVWFFVTILLRFWLKCILQRDTSPTYIYYLGNQLWYAHLQQVIPAQVSWYQGQGLFLPERQNIPYFQKIADHLVPFRDLIVIEKSERSSR